MMGFEPTTLGTTNRCSNQLSYTYRLSLSRVQIYENLNYKSLFYVFFLFLSLIRLNAKMMLHTELIVNEFKRRVFDESYTRIYKCLSLIEEKDLWLTPNTNTPSIGSLILHVCGNGRQWILSGLGSKKDNRERDNEFLYHANIKKADLIYIHENLKVNTLTELNALNDQKLSETVRIQGFNETTYSVLIHVIEHFSYHTGQISTLTKILTDKDLGYYKNLDLNTKS